MKSPAVSHGLKRLCASNRPLAFLTAALPALMAFCLGLYLPHAALAQTYPNKPIKMVLGFPPGGSGDFTGRLLADEMGKLLKQSIVVKNRAGAGTNIASELVAKAPADGYTVLLGGSFSHSVNPALFAKLNFDPVKDFVPVGKVVSSPTVIVVPASLGVNTLREFLALAAREGDKVSYASAGIGSPGHIAGGYLNRAANLRMTHIPYKGAGESVRALLAGEVQMIITSPASVMQFVAQGKAKALALTTAEASALVPGVPGAREAGLPNYDIDGWYGLYAPAGTPASVVARLHEALNATLALAEAKAKFMAQGFEVTPSPSPAAFAQWGEADRAKWAVIVRESGARVE
jgi:tripartite-type tricarboxylate transporter receptor subunit TctC